MSTRQVEKHDCHRQARTHSLRSERSHRFSLHSLKRTLGAKQRHSKSELGRSKPVFADDAIEIPIEIWMEYVFPFLDRAGQDRLAQAHREVALERRSASHRQKMDWPFGSLQRLSRPVKKVAFSPNNDILMVTYCKGKVLQYDKLRGLQPPIKGHRGIVVDVKFSPVSSEDTPTMATATRNDGRIRLWQQKSDTNDETEYECFRELLIYQHYLRHITWSPRGDRIASWGRDGFLRVSDCQTGGLKSQFWKTRLEVDGCHETVAFEPPFGGTVAFAKNNDRVNLWNIETDSIRGLPDLDDQHGSYAGTFVTGLAYSPDGRYFAVGCHVALIKFWSVRCIPRLESGLYEEEEDDGMSHDSEYTFLKQIFLGGGWSAATLLSFTSDGRFLACSNHGSQIRIVDTEANQVLTTLKGHWARIESLCFTSDARTLASGACDRTVRLWNTSRFCCG